MGITKRNAMTTKEKYKIIEDEMIYILDKLHIEAPNTGNILQFDIDGYFIISDCYNKTLKKYKTFEKAIDYLLEND